VRCAIYTRKSTEEGLSQEFNSLDAQREAAESYIQSQRGLGWKLIATRYDDGGFSGGNLDRPALQQLLADVDAGLVDCILVPCGCNRSQKFGCRRRGIRFVGTRQIPHPRIEKDGGLLRSTEQRKPRVKQVGRDLRNRLHRFETALYQLNLYRRHRLLLLTSTPSGGHCG
jgi:hypothetical protein